MKLNLLIPLALAATLATSFAEVVVMGFTSKIAQESYNENGKLEKSPDDTLSRRGYLIYEMDAEGKLVGIPTYICFLNINTTGPGSAATTKVYEFGGFKLNYDIVKKGSQSAVLGFLGNGNPDAIFSPFKDNTTFTGSTTSTGALSSIRLDPVISNSTESNQDGTDYIVKTFTLGGQIRQIITSSAKRIKNESGWTTQQITFDTLVNRLKAQGYVSFL